MISDVRAGEDVRDRDVVAEFHEKNSWGLSVTVDLFDCQQELIREAAHIEAFVITLCAAIGMRRYGEADIVRFGTPAVCGFTLMQKIETSSITAHFIEATNDACIDVFSCSPFPPYETAAFCRQFFGAQAMRVTHTFRGRNSGVEFPAGGD